MADKVSGRRRQLDLLGLLPFLGYVAIFLGVPTAAVVVGAFQDDAGSWTLSNVTYAAGDPYLGGFVTSTELSVVTAVIGAVAGLAIAFSVSSSPQGSLLRQVVSTASGVLAYFAGVPLAFAFIATAGTQGIATRLLGSMGLDVSGFTLFGFVGLTLVYVYFQIPLMVLVIFPALEGLRPQWQEAASNLGATRWQYWRLVGGPLLLPPFLGALLLLFANAFSAYATAYALTSGLVSLVPIQIASLMSGNVAVGQENVGNALGLGMIVLVGLALAGYALMQRRTSRWLR